MRFDVLTLFPEMLTGYLGQSLLKRALDNGLVQVQLHNLREFGIGRHKQVDDRPYGGGPGMVLMAPVVVEAVEAVQAAAPEAAHTVLLTPRGERLNQQLVEKLAGHRRLLLLCGRYEGFDERVKKILQPQEVSIGDYVLGGGEVAAMVLIDAVVRLVPGVLGDEESNLHDSFSSQHRHLEFDQYTRPREYRGLTVPEVLLGGNHEAIAAWRKEESLKRTQQQRADLL